MGQMGAPEQQRRYVEQYKIVESIAKLAERYDLRNPNYGLANKESRPPAKQVEASC